MKIIELKQKEIGLYKKVPHYNSSEFTTSAQHFKEFGVYTKNPINLSPTSQWYKHWVEEARRSIFGYNIGRDWIPGYFYWYLNYCPIEKAIAVDDIAEESIFILPETALNYSLRENKKDEPDISLIPPTQEEYDSFRAERVTGFPDFWDSDYDCFHYLHEAEESGEHAATLKTRGRGYSFKAASMLDRNFYLIPRSKSYAFASEKEYLIADGLLTKTWDMMSHIESHTPWGKRKSKVDTMMHKRASYLKTSKGIQTELGFGSEIIGVTFKNNPDKGRGKRGKLIIWEEFGKFQEGLIAWNIMLRSLGQGRRITGLSWALGCVCAGTKVWDNNGNLLSIEDLFKSNGIIGFDGNNIIKENIININQLAYKECIKLVTNSGRYLECSNDHPILIVNNTKRKRIKDENNKRVFYKEQIFKEAYSLVIGDKIAIIDSVELFGNKIMWEPRLIGWLIGDGCYTGNKTPTLSNCEDEINYYIETKFKTNINVCRITKKNKIYKEIGITGIYKELIKLGIRGQSKLTKTLPIDTHSYCENDIYELVGGLFDTDGYINYRKNKRRNTYIFDISISSASQELLLELQLLLQKIGIHGMIRVRHPRITNNKDKNDWYEYTISDVRSVINFSKKIKLFPKEKQKRLNKISQIALNIIPSYNFDNIRYEKIVSIENIGRKLIYNLTTNYTHTYIANGIITHNTGGTDIEYLMALEQLFTRGDGYKVHMIPNKIEPELGYEKTAFFVGEQKNHEIATDKNGNSHEEIALPYILDDRKKHLEATKSREMHLRYCAEAPIKPSEALMQIGNNLFPIDLLKQQRAYLMSHKESILDSAWVGSLYPDENGSILWKPDHTVIPIDHYPHNDLANLNGAVVIWEPPITNREGIVPPGLYISGNDNYDHDKSTTDSLGSTFIMNRITERIVAEYTGRPAVSSLFYLTNMYLLMHYNAMQNFENNLQGLRNYMRKLHKEHMLCDIPDMIKDKIDDKRVLLRGKGTPGTAPIIKYGLEQLLEWMMREAEPGTGILNLHRIKSIPFIDECIYFNDKGNFDRILAMIYLIILHEDRWKFKPNIDQEKSVSMHPFFANNPLVTQNKNNNKKSIIPSMNYRSGMYNNFDKR